MEAYDYMWDSPVRISPLHWTGKETNHLRSAYCGADLAQITRRLFNKVDSDLFYQEKESEGS